MCDVNTRHAQRQMKIFCCAGGEAVSDSSEACGKVSNGTWQAAMIHHVHNGARNENCHHPVCNRQQQRMGHINHFLTARHSYKVWHDDRADQSVPTFALTPSSSLLFTWFAQIIHHHLSLMHISITSLINV